MNFKRKAKLLATCFKGTVWVLRSQKDLAVADTLQECQ